MAHAGRRCRFPARTWASGEPRAPELRGTRASRGDCESRLYSYAARADRAPGSPPRETPRGPGTACGGASRTRFRGRLRRPRGEGWHLWVVLTEIFRFVLDDGARHVVDAVVGAVLVWISVRVRARGLGRTCRCRQTLSRHVSTLDATVVNSGSTRAGAFGQRWTEKTTRRSLVLSRAALSRRWTQRSSTTSFRPESICCQLACECSASSGLSLLSWLSRTLVEPFVSSSS